MTPDERDRAQMKAQTQSYRLVGHGPQKLNLGQSYGRSKSTDAVKRQNRPPERTENFDGPLLEAKLSILDAENGVRLSSSS